MKTVEGVGLSEKSYILSGKSSFFHRFCDSGFKTKWAGLWTGSKKFLDYFALKIDDVWLSPENCLRIEYDEVSCTHVYQVGDLLAKETLFIPEAGRKLICTLLVTNLKEKSRKVRIEMEVGVNIREWDENWHDRMYESRFLGNHLIVNSPEGSLVYGSSSMLSFSALNLYKDHYPGELERCFVPGLISMEIDLKPKSSEESVFMFSCGENEAEAMVNFDPDKNSVFQKFLEKENWYSHLLSNASIKTGIEGIDELFKWSVIGIEKLSFESKIGFGIFAGYPWFTQFWGRDSGWTIPAIVDYGNFEAARKALKTLVSFQSNDGEIPNQIFLNGVPSFGSADATPLWVSALNHYVLNSGDTFFLEDVEENLIDAISWCRERSLDGDGLLESTGRGTWMDTIERDGKPIEVQAIWLKSLMDARKLLEILKKEMVSFSEIKKIGKSIEKEFWDDSAGFYFDRIKWKFKDSKKTVNSIFPVLFGISKSPLSVIQRIESGEFTSKFGVRSVSKNESIFNPIGYHTGSVWGWITGLVACAEFLNNRPEKGIEYLYTLKSMMGRRCIGSLDEAWGAESGDPVLSKGLVYEPSAVLQAWGFGSVVRCVDECMLGLRVNALENSIIVSASLPEGMKVFRRKRIGKDLVDLHMERVGNELKASYVSREGRSYKLVKIPKI